MSNQIKVGSVIRLNPSMFAENFKLDGHFGQLGYVGIMRDWLFKVLRTDKHSYHGEIIEVEVLNVPEVQGNPILRVADCQPAVCKRTIAYRKIEDKIDVSQLQTELSLLRQKRERLALKYKPNGRTMKANAAEIEKIELAISSALNPATTKFYVDKLKRVVEVETSLADKKEELEMHLASLITEQRRANVLKETVKEVQGVKVRKLGGINVESNVYGKIFEQGLVTFIEQNKVPSDPNKKYVGIEIECIVKGGRDKLKKKFIEARLHKYVNVTDDGSINVDAPNYFSCEIRVLVSEDELENVLMRIQKVLRDKEINALVNRSCGLHVHLDHRTRNAETSYAALFNTMSLMRKAQPEYRQLNTYCKPNKNSSFKVTQERNDSERYSVINTHAFKKFQTLEIRVHEGTVNCVQIINWCKFLIGVVNNAQLITKKMETITELSSVAPSIPKVAMDYVSSRIDENGNEEFEAA